MLFAFTHFVFTIIIILSHKALYIKLKVLGKIWHMYHHIHHLQRAFTHHSSRHPAPVSQGWGFRIQRTRFKDAKIAGAENDDFSYFCTLDRTVNCFDLQSGKILHDHRNRSVRFIFLLCVSCSYCCCFCFF